MDGIKKAIDKGLKEHYLSSDIKDVREMLSKNYNVNLDENDSLNDKFVKQLKFKIKASLTKEKNDSLLQKVVSSYKDAIQKGIEKPVAFMNNLIRENKLVIQYKNLEKLTEEEIVEIIKDQNLVEILEMLEDE